MQSLSCEASQAALCTCSQQDVCSCCVVSAHKLRMLGPDFALFEYGDVPLRVLCGVWVDFTFLFLPQLPVACRSARAVHNLLHSGMVMVVATSDAVPSAPRFDAC